MKDLEISQSAITALLTSPSLRGGAPENVAKLEVYFHLPSGTLSSRLPRNLAGGTTSVGGETAYRRYLAEIHKLHYRLKEIPYRLAAEWMEVERFHTDPAWAILKGLECDTKHLWRIHPNRGYSPTSRFHWEQMTCFFGFLTLPAEGHDLRMRGKEMGAETFSLALLSDATLIAGYIEFRRVRSFNDRANNGIRTFLNFCTKLLYKERGFLWQQPEFGERLPISVPPELWIAWCETNRAKMLKMAKTTCGPTTANGSRAVSRDPFVAIRQYVRGRQHPLTALWELEGNLERHLTYSNYLSPVAVAEVWRSLLLVKLLAANPLRGENLTALTYQPSHWNDLQDPGVLYVPTHEDSSFYQTEDRSWRLRIPSQYFKVDRGPYDVPVARSLWTTLHNYFTVHRPVLNRAILTAIKARRLKEKLAPFNMQQETDVLRCPYVFRFARTGVSRVSATKFAAYKGIEQGEIRVLRDTMMSLTRKFLPGCAGFGPHACRHLVATEKLKNDPSGKYDAAAALHTDPETVELYYAEVLSGDRLKLWNEDHEKLRDKWKKGQL